MGLSALLYFVFLATGAVAQGGPSYSELAKQRVPAQFGTATGLLPLLNEFTGPDDIKPLRVALLNARELLDIFSYAYPTQPGPSNRPAWQARRLKVQAHHAALHASLGQHQDMWKLVRKDLNDGYEALGNFQDLAHSLVNYTADDVDAARAVCLTWRERFEGNVQRHGYESYMSSPANGPLYERPQGQLSRLFWGFNGTSPDPELDGTQNMAALAASLLAECASGYGDAVSLESIWEEPQHAAFHTYRKLVRSVLAVLQLFPEVLVPGSAGTGTGTGINAAGRGAAIDPPSSPASSCPRDPASAVGTLGKIFKDFGSINNDIFAVNYYTAKGEQEQAEAARVRVSSGWDAVRAWMSRADVTQQMDCLRAAVLTAAGLSA